MPVITSVPSAFVPNSNKEIPKKGIWHRLPCHFKLVLNRIRYTFLGSLGLELGRKAFPSIKIPSRLRIAIS